jgi:hypothetical protein
MILQLEAIYEVKFLISILIVLFGYQLAGYFFYHYYKLRDNRVQLNRILLSYGSLFLFGITTFFCVVLIDVDYGFIPNETAIEFLRSFGYACGALAIMLFLYFIKVEQFSFVVNLKILKYLIYALFIPIVIVIFLNSRHRITQLTLGIIVVAAGYILIIQYKILKNSVGGIKKSFILIVIGEIIGLAAIFTGARVVAELFSILGNPTILFLIGAPFLMLGIFIFFIAVYYFPPFYEFKWKVNLIKLFIINQKNNHCLYNYDIYTYLSEKLAAPELRREKSSEHIDKLFSGGILGIDSIISAITDTKDTHIDKIKHGEALILLDYGETPNYITYALLVKEDMDSIRYFLNTLKTQFESFYRELLKEIDFYEGKEELLFSSFDIIINNEIESR